MATNVDESGFVYVPILCESVAGCDCPRGGSPACGVCPNDNGSEFVSFDVCHCTDLAADREVECNPVKANGPTFGDITAGDDFNPLLCSMASDCACPDGGNVRCGVCPNDNGSPFVALDVCYCSSTVVGEAATVECSPRNPNGPGTSRDLTTQISPGVTEAPTTTVPTVTEGVVDDANISTGGTSSTAVAVSVSVIVVALVFLCCGTLWFLRRRRRNKSTSNAGLDDVSPGSPTFGVVPTLSRSNGADDRRTSEFPSPTAAPSVASQHSSYSVVADRRAVPELTPVSVRRGGGAHPHEVTTGDSASDEYASNTTTREGSTHEVGAPRGYAISVWNGSFAPEDLAFGDRRERTSMQSELPSFVQAASPPSVSVPPGFVSQPPVYGEHNTAWGQEAENGIDAESDLGPSVDKLGSLPSALNYSRYDAPEPTAMDFPRPSDASSDRF